MVSNVSKTRPAYPPEFRREQERDLLKRAAAFFAAETNRGVYGSPPSTPSSPWRTASASVAAQRSQQPLEVGIVPIVEDDEPCVHVMRGVLRVHADGVRVPARRRAGLEHGDLMPRVQQVSGGEPGNAGSDDRDPHRPLLRATTPVRIIRCVS
jgi:hypothetical protein